jgi:hypothetical protein
VSTLLRDIWGRATRDGLWHLTTASYPNAMDTRCGKKGESATHFEAPLLSEYPHDLCENCFWEKL